MITSRISFYPQKKEGGGGKCSNPLKKKLKMLFNILDSMPGIGTILLFKGKSAVVCPLFIINICFPYSQNMTSDTLDRTSSMMSEIVMSCKKNHLFVSTINFQQSKLRSWQLYAAQRCYIVLQEFQLYTVYRETFTHTPRFIFARIVLKLANKKKNSTATQTCFANIRQGELV